MGAMIKRYAEVTRLPTFGAGALFLVLLLVLRTLSQSRYIALQMADAYWGLWLLHTASKGLIVVAGALLLAAWLRGRVLEPWLAPGGLRTAALLAMLGCALLVGLLQFGLPGPADLPVMVTPALGMQYAAAIGGLIGFAVCAIVLIQPAAWARHWRSWRGAVLLAVLIAATLFSETGLFHSILDLRYAVEHTTLTLSLQIYSLFGLPDPHIAYIDREPLMAVPGFAVRIGAGCSGYQGVAIALVLLSGYAALEWRSLRLGRAAGVIAVAVIGTFLLNATRIALLFYIGVTGSPDVAVNGFHSNFGTLAVFAATLLAILALETAPFRRVALGRPVRTMLRAPVADGPTAFDIAAPDAQARLARQMLPLGATLLAGIVVGLTVDVINWFYAVPASVGAIALWVVRDTVREAWGRSGAGLPGFLMGIAVYGVWVLMVPPDPVRSAEMVAALFAAPLPLVIGWIVIRVIGASVIVPLVEELAFRGALQPALSTALQGHVGPRMAGVAGLLLASVAFGLLHSTILAGILAGLCFGVLALWRGNLADAILAHGVTNFLLCLTVLVLGHWSYW